MGIDIGSRVETVLGSITERGTVTGLRQGPSIFDPLGRDVTVALVKWDDGFEDGVDFGGYAIDGPRVELREIEDESVMTVNEVLTASDLFRCSTGSEKE